MERKASRPPRGSADVKNTFSAFSSSSRCGTYAQVQFDQVFVLPVSSQGFRDCKLRLALPDYKGLEHHVIFSNEHYFL